MAITFQPLSEAGEKLTKMESWSFKICPSPQLSRTSHLALCVTTVTLIPLPLRSSRIMLGFHMVLWALRIPLQCRWEVWRWKMQKFPPHLLTCLKRPRTMTQFQQNTLAPWITVGGAIAPLRWITGSHGSSWSHFHCPSQVWRGLNSGLTSVARIGQTSPPTLTSVVFTSSVANILTTRK